ncbi:hypothetical protein C7M84_023790 [Penaeus vannamei]|uniref:SCP domain-containing protein n=1 Tax=Penaeus vannamei TaxID=6689 RepID=A0A423U2T7_PENVA|nr:hypothetical protein C7M84_023790 [Penaeus vannamei]
MAVCSGKGATVTGRGSGEVDWARSQFVQECVREHNMLRSLHGAPPLILSEQLCKDAQEWANRLAHFQLLEYSTEHGRGENILTTTSKVNITGTAVARAWYETGRTFKFGVTGAADLAHAGPFSQVVWESTKYVGIGVARGTDGRSVVVARYFPPGNVGGLFSSNVKASCDTKTVARRPAALSRTRQEAQFYVSIALEPPGKVKKTDRMSMLLKIPGRHLDEDGLSPGTLLTHATAIQSLTPKSPVRNGAARTSKLFPICCVTPAKPEERWAQPSARSQQQQPQELQPSSQNLREELSPRQTTRASTLRVEEQLESIHGSPAEDRSHRHLSTSPLIKTRSPRRCSSPKALPRLARAARKANSPRRGASPKQGASPRKGATSRLRTLTGQGEHGVVIATL